MAIKKIDLKIGNIFLYKNTDPLIYVGNKISLCRSLLGAFIGNFTKAPYIFLNKYGDVICLTSVSDLTCLDKRKQKMTGANPRYVPRTQKKYYFYGEWPLNSLTDRGANREVNSLIKKGVLNREVCDEIGCYEEDGSIRHFRRQNRWHTI